MEKWKTVYKSAASAMKTAKCVVKLEDSADDMDEQDTEGEEDDAKKHKGPKKCMVVLEEEMG
jgi:hypothetical protein